MPPLADQLKLWLDDKTRSAPEQMAIDEAMWNETRSNDIAHLRFYQWKEPAVTLGYFDSYPKEEARPVVRRITGGGLVEHGDDLTFCLTLPVGGSGASLSSLDRYQVIHELIKQCLATVKYPLHLERDKEIPNPKGGPCFENPVGSDLLNSDGEKVVGGAQRRSHGSIIHQGSARLPEIYQLNRNKCFWIENFAESLSESVERITLEDQKSIAENAAVLVHERYACSQWNHLK